MPGRAWMLRQVVDSRLTLAVCYAVPGVVRRWHWLVFCWMILEVPWRLWVDPPGVLVPSFICCARWLDAQLFRELRSCLARCGGVAAGLSCAWWSVGGARPSLRLLGLCVAGWGFGVPGCLRVLLSRVYLRGIPCGTGVARLLRVGVHFCLWRSDAGVASPMWRPAWYVGPCVESPSVVLNSSHVCPSLVARMHCEFECSWCMNVPVLPGCSVSQRQALWALAGECDVASEVEGGCVGLWLVRQD